MRLARILKRELSLICPGDGVNVGPDTVSAANAQHFAASVDGKISMYDIDGDPSVDGARVAVAIATNIKQPADMSWCVVAANNLRESGIVFEQTLGDTEDSLVNAQHYDLASISMQGLSVLVMETVRQGEVDSLGMWDIAVALEDGRDNLGWQLTNQMNDFLKQCQKNTAFRRAKARKAAVA